MTFRLHYDNGNPITTGEMAGRSPKDEGARNVKTVQICLPKTAYDKLSRIAAKEHNGKISVAGRALLLEELLPA